MSPSTKLNVNGVNYDVRSAGVSVLSDVLRYELGLEGTKVGCGTGDCGACTVVIDNVAYCACLTAVGQLDGKRVTTVEGLGDDVLGARLQASFLRHGAAQCGFCTPGMLMAARVLIAKNPRPSGDEIQKALGGVLCRCTGYRPIIDALMDFVAEFDDEIAPVGKAVGTSISRVDGPERVSGRAIFGADAIPHEALVLKVVRSPYARAGFDFGDLDEYARTHDNVCAVLTHDDVPGVNRFGVIPGFEDQCVFAERETRFAGEAVALVGFEPETDMSLEDFPIEWHVLESQESVEGAMAPGALLLHDDRPGNVLVEGHVQRGDVQEALASADVVASGTFTTTFIEHAYIEPEAGWAEVVDDVVVVHVTTQAAYMDQESTAKILGVAKDRVRVVPTEVGGGFGGKLDVSIQPHLALAALRLGRRVQITYDRRESMVSTTKRHPSLLNVRIGANRDGTLSGIDVDATFNTGAYASWGPTVANRVPVHASGPYFVRDYRAHSRAVLTNVQPSGAFRGFGVPQAAIAQEVLFDDLALALDLDPLEFRIQNALSVGQTTVTGQVLEASVGIRDCLMALREPWAKARAEAQRRHEHANERYRMGVGVAGIWYGCGNTSISNPSTFKAGLRCDGAVVLHQGAIDIGQGSSTVITQIFADALSVDVRSVLRVSGDTHLTPDAGKTSASRQTYVSGMAAMLVGQSLRRKVLAALSAPDDAALRFNANIANAVTPDGTLSLDLSSLSVDEDGYVMQATETFDPPTTPLDANGQGDPYAVYGFGCQMVELEVDVLTGLTKLTRITAAYDVGRAINPQLVIGQIEGGIAQGIGMALMESYIPGRTTNLHDYLIPTIGDVPEIESILIESNDPGGPYGAKGVGEHTIIATTPAILNAIRHATGARVTDVPATPERILKAMEEL